MCSTQLISTELNSIQLYVIQLNNHIIYMISNDYSFHRVITLHSLIKNGTKQRRKRSGAAFENRENERNTKKLELELNEHENRMVW